jgi:hypothetical protein
MSTRQAVVLASRVLCVYFLYCAAANLVNFPGHLLNLHHHLHDPYGSALLGYDKFWLRYYSLESEAATLRLAVELCLAGAFYRCGERVSRFLLGSADESND